jgi:terminase small subunit-like protein
MGSPVKSDRLARFVEIVAPEREEGTLEEMFQRMTSGEGLPGVCASWDVPYGRMLTWLMGDEKRYAVYLRALEVRGHALVDEAVSIADEQKEAFRKNGSTYDPDVARDTLRVQTRLRVAKAHAPALYGEKEGAGAGGVTVVINRGVNRSEEGSPTHGNAPLCEITAGGRILTINETNDEEI